MDIDKYDEYYTNRPQREVITIETNQDQEYEQGILHASQNGMGRGNAS